MVNVTISLPENLYQHATRLSKATQINVSKILTEALAFTLPTMDVALASAEPVNQLDDEALVALAESNMPTEQDERLSELLHKQREKQLSVKEASELLSLMLTYRSGWWRKTEALVEAVKRGLKEPLQP